MRFANPAPAVDLRAGHKRIRREQIVAHHNRGLVDPVAHLLERLCARRVKVANLRVAGADFVQYQQRIHAGGEHEDQQTTESREEQAAAAWRSSCEGGGRGREDIPGSQSIGPPGIRKYRLKGIVADPSQEAYTVVRKRRLP